MKKVVPTPSLLCATQSKVRALPPRHVFNTQWASVSLFPIRCAQICSDRTPPPAGGPLHADGRGPRPPDPRPRPSQDGFFFSKRPRGPSAPWGSEVNTGPPKSALSGASGTAARRRRHGLLRRRRRRLSPSPLPQGPLPSCAPSPPPLCGQVTGGPHDPTRECA